MKENEKEEEEEVKWYIHIYTHTIAYHHIQLPCFENWCTNIPFFNWYACHVRECVSQSVSLNYKTVRENCIYILFNKYHNHSSRVITSKYCLMVCTTLSFCTISNDSFIPSIFSFYASYFGFSVVFFLCSSFLSFLLDANERSWHIEWYGTCNFY